MDDDKLLAAVGRTAIGVARVRAGESARPDALFSDPYAAGFVAASGVTFDAEAPDPADRARRSAIALHVVVRTRFFDDYLLEATGAAGCRQVVLVGAGLDTRAFRLDWPDGTRLFELDQPAVLRLKDEVLAAEGALPRCERTTLPVDLRESWSPQLVAAGLRPDLPTAWLAEGVLVYLEPHVAAAVLDELTAVSSPGSRFSAERGDRARRMAAGDRPLQPDDVVSMWQDGVAGGLASWLDGHGWTSRQHELADLAARYDRPAPAATRSGFVTATRTGGPTG